MGPVPASVALGIRTGVSACGSQHPLNATACRALSCLLPVLSLGPAECHHCDKHRAPTCQQSIPRATEMERWCINDAQHHKQKALRRCVYRRRRPLRDTHGLWTVPLGAGHTVAPSLPQACRGASPAWPPCTSVYPATPAPGSPVNGVHGRSTGASITISNQLLHCNNNQPFKESIPCHPCSYV